MRLALLITLCVLPMSALAKDQGACVARCSDKLTQCTKGCKDDKCMSRCADRIEACQSACGSAAPGKVPKGENGNGNEKGEPAPPPTGALPKH